MTVSIKGGFVWTNCVGTRAGMNPHINLTETTPHLLFIFRKYIASTALCRLLTIRENLYRTQRGITNVMKT